MWHSNWILHPIQECLQMFTPKWDLSASINQQPSILLMYSGHTLKGQDLSQSQDNRKPVPLECWKCDAGTNSNPCYFFNSTREYLNSNGSKKEKKNGNGCKVVILDFLVKNSLKLQSIKPRKYNHIFSNNVHYHSWFWVEPNGQIKSVIATSMKSWLEIAMERID